MKILKVHIENFLGLGIAAIKLDRAGTILVEGENGDSKSAISNGAGKSTVFEAPYWCLYGLTRRGKKGDDVINRHTKGGCLVRTLLEIGGKHCVVTRTRKYGSPADTSLKIEFDGDDVTRGTTRDSQAFLEDLIGMSAMTFSKAVFFGQGDQKPFASLTDGELKLVFEQALGLTWFSESKGKVGGYLSGLKQLITQGGTNINLMIGESNLANNKVESMRDLISRDEEEKKTWRQSLDKRLAELVDYQEKLVAVIAGKQAEQAEHTTANAGFSAKLDELKALNAKLGDAISEKSSALARSQAMATNAANTIKALNKRCDELVALAGSACYACTQPVTEAVAGHAKAALQADIAGESATLEDHKATFATSHAEKSKLDALLNQLCSKIKLTEDNIRGHDQKIAGLQGELNNLQLQLGNNKNEVESLKATIAAGSNKDAEIEANKKTLDMLLSNLDVTNDRIKQERLKIAEYEQKAEKANVLNDALGNAGVKSYVFDSITPELNTWSNHYLQILEPDMSVEISTVSKLKNGDFREKFSISVDNVNGDNSLAGSSGGEQQKINLSVALAFNKLMRSMAGEDVPMLVLDEPFEALDEGSSDQVLELLEDLKADNLYLITHNKSVRDLIPNRMVVEKHGGVAVVRDAV